MTRSGWLVITVLAAAACSGDSGPQVGSQTNWLVDCASSAECGELECICGTCTASCENDLACAGLSGAACSAAVDDGPIALCSPVEPPSGICLPRCEASCDEGTSCMADACVPLTDVARVSIDPAVSHQTLVGFGASLAHADDAIVSHPDKTALYDLLFEESGFEVLRLRNRYDADQSVVLPAQEIVAAATERIGRTPFLFMTSGTPPAELKANGSRWCGGDPATCTLVTLPGGGFDYASFAEYWRVSLQAYTDAGVVPDYISIQNNPNWVPPAGRPNEACRFLPEEGMATVSVDGSPVEVRYPGYREALAAVSSAIADLPQRPRLGAPEASDPLALQEYVTALGAANFDALALHLYDIDDAELTASLYAARALAEQVDRPVFQTEMQADGLQTAVLVHHALTAGNASAYLQNDMVSVVTDFAGVALVRLTEDGFEAQEPYYALWHYAKHTDPGWVRVDLDVGSRNADALLGSAWLAPDDSALTVVLVNRGRDDLTAELSLPEDFAARVVSSELTRTTFGGVERAAVLGELPSSDGSQGSVRVLSRSVATVSFALE